VKKADWALIVIIVTIVGVVSWFVVGALVPPPTETPETVKTAVPISADIDKPNPTVFSADAINPTVKTTIGDQNSTPPFTLGSE
jgi:hypothetical protein